MNFTNFLSSQSTWNESFRYLEKTQWVIEWFDNLRLLMLLRLLFVEWMNSKCYTTSFNRHAISRLEIYWQQEHVTESETFVFLFDDGTPGLDTHTQISSHQFRKTIFSHSQNKFLSFRVTYKYVVLTPDTVSQRIRRAERVDSLSRASTEFSMQTKTMRCQ